MRAKLHGDFSKYPSEIRDIFRALKAEVLEVRSEWLVYHHLFMEDEQFTQVMSRGLGGVLGALQNMLQTNLLLAIARLVDPATGIKGDKNLSLRNLCEEVPANTGTLRKDATKLLNKIGAAAGNVKFHRHKSIAHYDLEISLEAKQLPSVTFREIRRILEQIEAFLNLFERHFENSETLFTELPAREITGRCEATVLKALAYDRLEADGTISKGEWKRRVNGPLTTEA
ncbi:MAG TPA: hypothetical protein VJA21_08365 [Verrucomicrobiae bacterium]